MKARTPLAEKSAGRSESRSTAGDGGHHLPHATTFRDG